MKNIYKSFLLLMVGTIFSVGAFSQANIVAQSFEGTGTWNYSEFPNPYTVYSPPTDIWGICGNTYVSTTSTPQIYNHGDVVAPFFGNISSASEGTHYYGMQDINNPYTSTLSGTWPADPGTNWHTLTFDPVTLPGGGTFPIKVAFDYYTDGFDGTDYIGWEIAWDNDTVWSGLTTTNYSNTDAWTTEEFTAPAGVTYVRLRVAAKQNGGTDFGAFDNFRVFLDVGDLTPPTVTSLDAANDSTLVLTTSESVTNGSDVSNYSGVAVSSASVNANGDTITLSLSTPLVIGQYTDVYVTGLVDSATNVMTNDTLIVVFNNTDLSSGLTITELMYNDPGNYDNLDYIELYNNSVNTIALGGLRIDDAISFVFPEYDLLAGEYAILAKDAFTGSSPCNTYPAGCGFETFFGFAPTFEWSTGYLSTSGEQITILNTQDGIVVDLDYDDSWAGGLGDGDGYSIVICDPSSDINVDTNWTAAIPSVIPACGSCTVGLGIGTTTIYAHPMADCPPIVYGCMDTLALNYDVTANIDDGTCTFSSNLGCIDSTAINYDATASIDDGSCTYPIPPMVDLFFSEYAEGSSSNKYFEIYNPTSDTVDLAHYAFPTVSNAPTTPGVYEYWNDFPSGAVILPNDVYIVGHPYSDVAISGVSDHTYTYLSNGDDGLALVYGSNPGSPMDPTAGGYVIVDFIGDWNGDPGSGWSVAGVSDATKDHTLVRKCDVTQGNDDWVASAGTDAVNSEWIVYPQNYWSDLGFFTTCTSITYGCMDATANNYDAAATIDDGSCTYSVLGCTDSTAFNYDPLANTDDGSCVAVVLGCTDATATNYDATANTDDGTCTFFNTILGCTDSTAFNYDPLANTDDGSCVAVVLGCTDPAAGNYDASANTDDGSCLAAMVNLYFSEYAEGSSNNKYFEIYNPTSDTVDLSSYAYPSTSNAPTTVGVYEYWNDFDAGAVILPNDVYIVAHGSSDPIILAAANETHNYLSNGDDGYALVYGSNPGSPMDPTAGGYVIVDFIGDWNGDPGSGWSVAGVSDATKDHTLVRKCDVTQGNDDWVASAGTDAVNSEWIVYPQNYWSDLGFFTTCTPSYGCTDPAADNYDANATTDDGSCTYPPTILTITTTVCNGATSVQMTGPWWGWDPWAGPVAVDNGNGTWTFTFSPAPTGDMEYLLVVDGVQEDLVAAGTASGDWSCTPVTDYWSYANRLWVVGSGDVTNVYGTCGACVTGVSGCTDPAADNYDANATTDDGSCTYPPTILTITTTVCNGATSVQMTGPWWGWDPWAGPVAVDNGNGTWTFTFSPAPTGDMEYLLVVDGVQEDLVAAGTASGDWSCTPVTDYWSYANRLWVVGSGDVTNVYGTCGACAPVVSGCTDPAALNYDASATVDDGSCTYCVDGCTDATQFNYDPNATCDDGSCQPFTYGCTDATASNYNSTVNTDDGSCVYLGCTDATADNYDATATVDDGSCTYTVVNGCTDPTAVNYDATATVDDGSCTYSTLCTEDAPTGLFVDGIIHSRAVINWDNMNSSTCTVDQYRIRFREVGTSSWTQKTMGGPVGSCTWGNQRIDKLLLGLTGNTTYEYEMKAWYCGGGSSAWTGLSTFTTADNCPNVGNLTAVGANPTKATFTWDASNGSYEFVRLKARVDSISNPSGSDWFQIGGAGVAYGTYTKDKNGLTAGETYRGQARAFCDPNGGAYFSLTWTPLVYWTQPTSRIEGGTAIANLDVYPNPSRDLFNVTFTSEDVQDLEVRVINVVGEVVYTENLQQFVGEYTKSIDLESYTKGVYFLEITTNSGVVNKKLILQ